MTTRNLVPRADGEGSLGTAAKQWGAMRAKNIYVDGVDITEQVTETADKADAAAASATAAAGSVVQAEAIKNAMIAAYGYPLNAATASAMTDTTKIYVYTGSETGYTFGDWYFHNGTAWTDGGVYNAMAFNTDPTLTVEGAAADAKKTGNIKSDVDSMKYKTSVTLQPQKSNTGISWGNYDLPLVFISNETITVTNNNNFNIYLNIYNGEGTKLAGPKISANESENITMPIGTERVAVYSDSFPISVTISKNGVISTIYERTAVYSGNIIFSPYLKIDLSSYDNVVISGTDRFYLISETHARQSILFSDIANNIAGATFNSTTNTLTIPMPAESALILNPITNEISLLSDLSNNKIPPKNIVLLYRYYSSYGGFLFNTSYSRQFKEMVLNVLDEEGVKETIEERYKEQIANVYAASDYYRGAGSVSWTKNLTLLMVSDSHEDVEGVSNAIELANKIDAIDAILHLGDIGPRSPVRNQDIPMITMVTNATVEKPFFLALGNHDVQHEADSTTYTNVTESVAMSQAQLNTAAMYSERGYGYYDFDAYKMRMIILNDYDYPSTTNNGNYTVYGNNLMFQQDQVDMVVQALESIPEGYTAFIASHFSELGTLDDSIIDQHNGTANIVGNRTQVGENESFMSDVVISDIINAFKGKTTLSKIYTYENRAGATIGAVNVSADFSGTSGLFACWLCGHRHRNGVARSSVGNYWIYVNDTSCVGTKTNGWATQYSNIPRTKGTNTRDLLTCVSFDTANRVVKFARIGAHISRFLDDTNFISLSY